MNVKYLIEHRTAVKVCSWVTALELAVAAVFGVLLLPWAGLGAWNVSYLLGGGVLYSSALAIISAIYFGPSLGLILMGMLGGVQAIFLKSLKKTIGAFDTFRLQMEEVFKDNPEIAQKLCELILEIELKDAKKIIKESQKDILLLTQKKKELREGTSSSDNCIQKQSAYEQMLNAFKEKLQTEIRRCSEEDELYDGVVAARVPVSASSASVVASQLEFSPAAPPQASLLSQYAQMMSGGDTQRAGVLPMVIRNADSTIIDSTMAGQHP